MSSSSFDGMSSADGAVASPDLPVWAIVLGWELRRGRQVILHGEVNDRSWLSGEPATVKDVVAAYLEATGSDVVGWWDPVDGLTFPVAGHAERFGRIRRGQAARDEPADLEPRDEVPAPAPAFAGNNQSRNDQGAATQGTDAHRPGSRRAAVRQANRDLLAPQDPATAALPTDLGATIDLVRGFVTRPEASTAFVFQDLDVALPAADPTTAPLYLRLRNTMREAVVPADPSGSPPPHRRNPVLVVTGNLDRLPPWFHTEDPRIVPLRLSRPDQAERRLWLSLLAPHFHGMPTERGRGALVGATDGLSAWDLDALARTSVFRRVPADRPTRLLDAMRINVRTNPWERLDADMVAESAHRLGEHVIGQQRAVEAVADALKTAYVGLDFGSSGAARPRGVFFFVGPTGVGKTELAKSVARLLFGDESAYARFDMSEYREEHAAERLAGAPPGYVGYEAGGELTRRVQERPFSVLLFDEIEKANPVVLDKFLQILEDGRLTDGRGQTAYFSQSLIIFTSNTGAKSAWELDWDRDASPDGPPYELLQSHFVKAVEHSFGQMGRPEIFGRLRPGIVVFDVLRARHVTSITDRLLDQLAESALERQRVRLEPDRASVHAWMRERMRLPGNAQYGGRQIRNELEVLRTGLVRHFVRNRPAPGALVRFSVDLDGALRIDGEPADVTDTRRAAYGEIGTP